MHRFALLGSFALLRSFALLGSLVLLASACGSDRFSAGSTSPPGAVTTTFAYDPPSQKSADTSALPPLEDPARFDRGRTRIGAIEGFDVSVAEGWAVDSGWLEILVIDIDNPEADARPAVYWPFVLGLYERDDVVVEAWVGG